MQFDFKEKAKKRQDRNSPIKPLFCIQFENPSKVSWGEFQISMGFVQPPRSAPIFDSPHESLVTLWYKSNVMKLSWHWEQVTLFYFFCVSISAMILFRKQPIKVSALASIYYSLFLLFFSSARSAEPSTIPIIEVLIPIKKTVSVCRSI